MNIALYGYTGLLGTELSAKLLRRGHTLHAPTRQLLEQKLKHPDEYLKELKEIKPDYIINCVAFTDVDGAEKKRAEADAANELFPMWLTTIAAELNITIIHISTDFVYSGDQKVWGGMGWCRPDRLHNEEWYLNPKSVYAKTKLAGEKQVQAWEKHYIIRTSWLFGGHKKRTWMDIALDSKPKYPLGYQMTYGTPTYTPHLAEGICQLIEKQPEFGVYNFANRIAGPITKLEGLQKAQNEAKNIGECVHTLEYFMHEYEAHRPFNSGLNVNKFCEKVWQIPTLEEAIKEYVKTKATTKV